MRQSPRVFVPMRMGSSISWEWRAIPIPHMRLAIMMVPATEFQLNRQVGTLKIFSTNFFNLKKIGVVNKIFTIISPYSVLHCIHDVTAEGDTLTFQLGLKDREDLLLPFKHIHAQLPPKIKSTKGQFRVGVCTLKGGQECTVDAISIFLYLQDINMQFNNERHAFLMYDM